MSVENEKLIADFLARGRVRHIEENRVWRARVAAWEDGRLDRVYGPYCDYPRDEPRHAAYLRGWNNLPLHTTREEVGL